MHFNEIVFIKKNHFYHHSKSKFRLSSSKFIMIYVIFAIFFSLKIVETNKFSFFLFRSFSKRTI